LKKIGLVPYKIVESLPMVTPGSRLTAKIYSPSQVSAFILQKMKETAEAHLGQKVDQQ